MSASLLSVEDLCIDYLTETGDVRIVDHLSFDIKPGEILGLAGESGSGKTTTLKGILRLLGHPAAITGGSVLFKDMDILDMDEDQLRDFRWKEISLVMQSAMNALNEFQCTGLSERGWSPGCPLHPHQVIQSLNRLIGGQLHRSSSQDPLSSSTR